jgi:hypothetical protein
VIVLDAIAPTDEETWARLDAKPPTVAIVLKPDHIRDVELFVERYGVTAFGPWLYWRDDIPKTRLEFFEPGMEAPGGLLALYDGRGRMETRCRRSASGSDAVHMVEPAPVDRARHVLRLLAVPGAVLELDRRERALAGVLLHGGAVLAERPRPGDDDVVDSFLVERLHHDPARMLRRLQPDVAAAMELDHATSPACQLAHSRA